MIYSHLNITPTKARPVRHQPAKSRLPSEMLKNQLDDNCLKVIFSQRIDIWPLVRLHLQGSHARQRKFLIFAMLLLQRRRMRVNKMSGWMAGRMLGGRSLRQGLKEGWLWKGGRVPAVGQTNINGVPTHLPNSALLCSTESILIICDFTRQKPHFSSGTS